MDRLHFATASEAHATQKKVDLFPLCFNVTLSKAVFFFKVVISSPTIYQLQLSNYL